MGFQTVFKRYELKFLLTKEQYGKLRWNMEKHMAGDEFGKSTICNLYFDTPDYLLIRRSLEKPVYKEKLRLRSYGTAKPDSTSFIEIKKKYQSVVYKRRISVEYAKAIDYLLHGKKIIDTQISREIDYLMQYYGHLSPRVFLSYEREAFYGRGNHDFRMTFDENILWRDEDLCLTKGAYGLPILQDGQVLLEVKTAFAIPMWLTTTLSELGVYKTSFSKYGNAYQQILAEQQNKRSVCS